MGRFDVAKFKKPEKSYLQKENIQQPKPTEQVVVNDKKTVKKVEVEQKKIGRPRSDIETASERFSLAFTKTELDELKIKAGRIPLAAFIKDALRDAKII